MRIFLFLLLIWSGPVWACEGEVPCKLGDREYHVRVPDGWDGVTPMPVLLHFHGWQRTGALPVRHQRIAGATRSRGVLLVAPTGLGKSWDFWRPGSRDTGFARAVLEDVKAHFPVDPSRIYISGYSWGSRMAWRFVCEDGADIAALLGISGTLDQDETCETAPREVRQVYGLNDQVLDYPYGSNGEADYPVFLWRQRFGCGAGIRGEDWNAVDFLAFERTVWPDCPGGQVTLDTHPGGHFIPHGWIGWQLDQLMGREPVYP